jgi:hypothetical protein
MGKKDKVHFQYSGELDAVDAELAEAMDQLDQTNLRINELLRAYEPPPPETPAAQGSQSSAIENAIAEPPHNRDLTSEALSE